MNIYEVLWLIWIVAFLVIEVRALRRRGEGDTLSEFVWKLTKPWPIRFAFGGFLVWLTLHLLGVPV